MSFDPGPIGDATLDHWTLVFVRELRHSPDVVWQALTDPAELDQWAPFRAAADLAKPGDTTLTMIDGDTMMDMPATCWSPTRPRCWNTRGATTGCAGPWNPPAAAPG